ncbi:ankyrin unc44 [Fusarium pseudocircinatum]|uniref:Ankyrin unc44 n=1 Tax=Fusarium pseudocircinatum TaxID=56676 RepID=A0A8H5KFC5_9HYPO|nr:ankyrin unc44 [Fusarium pseudocircinatum]
MPYLSFSTYQKDDGSPDMDKNNANKDTDSSSFLKGTPEFRRKQRQRLVQAYRKQPIHLSPTLDEYYYHFTKGQESEDHRKSRNETQVVTRYLSKYQQKNKDEWTLLRVNQLWAWTIEEKWLITASSCASSDKETKFVKDIVEYLQKQGKEGSNRRGPKSPAELRDLIAEYCINVYERKYDPKYLTSSLEEVVQTSQSSQAQPGSRDRPSSSQKNAKNPPQHESYNGNISESQQKVQSRLTRSKTGLTCHDCHIGHNLGDDINAQYVLSDILELDQAAAQTQEALQTTIQLQDSHIANLQAEESAKQGRTLYIFTLFTIVFVPLSFFSSLFALNVDDFLKTPTWALIVICYVHYTKKDDSSDAGEKETGQEQGKKEQIGKQQTGKDKKGESQASEPQADQQPARASATWDLERALPNSQ